MAIIHRDSPEDLIHWEPFAHWEPFRGMERLQQDMNRLFDRFLPSGNGEIRSLNFIPAAEMEETDDVIQLRLEVPGMEAKDLDVQVTDSSITVRGERKSETTTEEKGVIRSELHYGKFERIIPLPARIQTDTVKAECEHGMLRLTLPKVESEQRKAVKVTIN